MSAATVSKLAFVDLLRGIAILMVVVVHTAIVVPGLTGHLAQLVRYGQMGVQLFFVASAYTLALSFGRTARDGVAVREFYIRRYWRIAPMYYLGIAAYFGLTLVKSILETGGVRALDPYTPLNVLANVLFMHGLYPPANNNIVPGGWSIGTEMLFYLVFPFLFGLAGRVHNRGGTGGVVALVLGAVVVNVLFQAARVGTWALSLPNNSFFYLSFVNQLPVFMIGLMAYFVICDRDPRGHRELFVDGGLFLASTALSWLLWQQREWGWTFVFMPVAAGTSFYFLLLFARELPFRVRLIERIGQLSYSIYVVHFLLAWYVAPRIMQKLGLTDSPALNLLASLSFVLGAAAVVAKFTERYVEARGIAVGAKAIVKMRLGS